MGSFLPFETLRKEKDAGVTSAGFRWFGFALHKLQKGNWDGSTPKFYPAMFNVAVTFSPNEAKLITEPISQLKPLASSFLLVS